MEKLDIIVVPVSSGFAVLPAVMVRQILPYAPLMPSEEQKPYMLGSLIVQNDKLDVIDIGSIFDGSSAAVADIHNEKLIWFSPLQKDQSSYGFILRSVGLPQFLVCRQADIIEKGKSDHPLIASYIQVRGLVNPNNKPVFIIDLINLEKEIAR